MYPTNTATNRAGPPGTPEIAVDAERVGKGEAIGQATLRGLAALLLCVLAAATRPVESSADLVAAEPADQGLEDDEPGLNIPGRGATPGAGDSFRV